MRRNIEMSELEIAIQDFIESCHRTENHDMDDNVKYFMRENNHMNLDEDEVKEIFEELDT